ncbi:lipopolysaccharide biosynthesis protein [Parvibacter caecicola]|uniref:O-antigen/teichoic acid export membrane protein n=1 Tax=Parvibacter caecicola TaxID=747645 RepID=A0A7W5D221_9ACTN|nr:lipopolysaccharide biosynthesis protein [Parvibacter caecicola]MBB3171260.1 O-antigen/teichoic acid export membrane protein [Parvibacter caecicola]MCR2041138.1 lipopolysaccharide biosynthesis protein [Parvibacter caecicola]
MRNARGVHRREAAPLGRGPFSPEGARGADEPRPSVRDEMRARERFLNGEEPAEETARLEAAAAAEETRRQRAAYTAPQRPAAPRRGNPITRLANQWFDRVMGALGDGGLSEQEAQYASHNTTKDFIWNTVGVGAWGMVFPILTMIATQLVGVENAGMLSMAFVVGSLLWIVANFGVRTYQISDVNEVHSFADYQVNRWITCVAMVLVGCLYCAIRGYDTEMFYLSMGIFFYRMVDGLADVYEGRLQQVDKLYLAGISQALRSVLVLVVFAVLLVITQNMVVAAFAMAIAAAATFVVVTYPLTLLETPKSRRVSWASVGQLFKNTAPLFVALFLYALIDNMPKFVMEGALSYDNQLYFNALYFPAQGILITSQLVYKPLLVRMAGVWQDTSKRRQFDLIMIGILGVIVAITAVNVLVMAWIGIPIMGFLYGIDFEQFRGLLFIMLAAGGVTAAIDFMYQVVTVMRRQKDVTTLYLVTFGFSLFVPILLVMFTGLPGAVIGYLIVMTLLFVLLVWEYFRIRKDMAHEAQLRAAREGFE